MYDALMVSAIVDELNAQVIDGRIQQVTHVDELTVALEVYAAYRRRWLVLSADSDDARVVLTDERVGVDSERVTPFLLLLRKYARGGRIVAVSQPQYERILRVSIAKRMTPHNESAEPEEEGEIVYSELIAELMGRRSNLILVDEAGRIRDAVKRVTPDMSRVRSVLPGRAYTPPPPQNKLAPMQALVNDLLRDAVVAEFPVERWLIDRYQGISPTLAREVAFRAGVDAATPARMLRAGDAERLIHALDEVFAPLITGAWQPMTYELPTGRTIASPIRLLAVEALEGMSARPHTSFSAAVIDALAHDGDADTAPSRHAARRERLVAEVHDARDRAAQRVRSLREQQEQAADAEVWRRMGEAIYAAMFQLRQGAVELRTDDGLVVPLDPALTPSENASRYFERYRKGRAATENLPALIEDAHHTLAYLDQLVLAARQAETFDEIEAVRYEWESWRQRHSSTHASRRPPRRPPGTARKPIEYRTERGDRIWVGRTGHQNDAVTFEIAGPGDLWLHARNMPGAHVVLRWNGPPDDAVLARAAALAAWYSDGRAGTTAPVDVTERRYVRKLRGGGPGMVTYRNERTLNVRPRAPRDAGLTSE